MWPWESWDFSPGHLKGIWVYQRFVKAEPAAVPFRSQQCNEHVLLYFPKYNYTLDMIKVMPHCEDGQPCFQTLPLLLPWGPCWPCKPVQGRRVSLLKKCQWEQSQPAELVV